MPDTLINRAQLLIQQNRYEEAGRVLKDILSREPNNIHVLAMLSQVMLQQGDAKNAEELINDAIGLSPDIGYLFFVKARIAIQTERYDEAEKNLSTAVGLNPEDGDFFALWASVKLARKKFDEALDLANQALDLDPENILALNMRSTALMKLNRKEDSYRTIEGALAHDPNNSYTHSNYGWSLLEKGDHKKALEHFREALKNNPNLQHAQAGMAEALKAKYAFYRLFLKYAFFMSNLASKYQWAIIIGFYVATRLLKVAAERNEALRPILTPVLVLIALIAFSTWVITPISNLFLRLNPYGKYLLDKEEKLSSNFVAISLMICIIGLLLYLVLSDERWLVVSIFGFAMMVPLGSMFSGAKHKSKLVIYAGAMALLGVAGIIQVFSTGVLYNGFVLIFLVGFIAYQWVANFVKMRK